jgi:hypothetical protein
VTHLKNDYAFFSKRSYESGRRDEAKRIVFLIQTVIDKHEFEDYVGRDKDWNGDPNLAHRLEIPYEILFLLTGEPECQTKSTNSLPNQAK